MPRENKNSIYAHALVRPVVALSVWRPELSIHIASHIGKLRSIFNRLGRTGFSNPFARPRVKEFIMFVREEQAQRPL